MLDLEPFDGIYLHRDYVDMRKSINGLSVIVETEMELELFGKYLFVFCNKRRNKLKILYWDSSGFALWYKRLEQAKFFWPKKLPEDVIKMELFKLRWLLEGYDIWRQKPHQKLSYERVS